MFSILVTNLCSVVNRKAQSCQSSSWLHSSKNPVRFFCPAVHCVAVQRFESWHGCFASWTARKQLKITAQQPLIYHYCLPQTASMHLKTMHYSFTTLFFTFCFYVLQNWQICCCCCCYWGHFIDFFRKNVSFVGCCMLHFSVKQQVELNKAQKMKNEILKMELEF